jgi:hypothetical protein
MIGNAALRRFRLVYTLLTLNFVLPAISYALRPDLAVGTMARLNALLGGGPWPAETGGIWHMLAVGNVMTLGFMCLLLLIDLRRFYPVLPALAFLKGFSALHSLAIALSTPELPAFHAVFLLDALTTWAMIHFAWRARRSLA